MDLDLQRFYNINRRALMWIVFFAILYLLSDFFALVFLTFIFGFLMRQLARYLVVRVGIPYWSAVLIPYLVTVGLLILLTVTAVPRVIDEAIKFSRHMPVLIENLAKEVIQVAPRYGLEHTLSKYVHSDRPLASGVATTEPGIDEVSDLPPVDEPVDPKLLAQKIQVLLVSLIPGFGRSPSPGALPALFSKLAVGVFQGVLEFLLAILLSFLIVLDYDRIAETVATWRSRPVGQFFHGAAASVVEFSGVVGNAFQCQMVVALLNASITCIGLAVLQIQPLVLLTTIVFLLGLIPVLGVFVSSVPIILIAFNDFGLTHALAALGMIVVVHMLEAYVFNPRIYAARFHLNPVIVLIILLVGEQLFGVWGMLLSIPVTHYVLNVADVPHTPFKKRRKRRADAAAPA